MLFRGDAQASTKGDIVARHNLCPQEAHSVVGQIVTIWRENYCDSKMSSEKRAFDHKGVWIGEMDFLSLRRIQGSTEDGNLSCPGMGSKWHVWYVPVT